MINNIKSASNEITQGNASRFIHEKWLNNAIILPIAFDLRNLKSGLEKYVSFSLVTGSNDNELLEEAHKEMQKKQSLKNNPGAVIVLNVETCISEINDFECKIISFKDEILPHCGLYYETSDLTEITEAKNILCLLAKERIKHLKSNLIPIRNQRNIRSHL